jgi:hypothetical protein
MSKGLAILFIGVALCVGGFVGFVLGIATSEAGKELLSGMNYEEEPADIQNAVTLDQPGYRLQHPGNWTFDLSNPDHDPAHYFFLDTPGGSYFELSFEEDGADPEADYDVAQENLDYLVSRFESVLKSPTRMPFQKFGKFQGRGLEMTGRSFGNKVTVRLFSMVDGTKTLTISQFVYEMDREHLQPGLDLIERTLELK